MSDQRPAPPGWYPHMGGHRYWDGQLWTVQFRPGGGPGGAGDDNRHLWWALSPAYTFGLVAFVPALHAAIKLRRRQLWWWATGLVLADVLGWVLVGGGPEDETTALQGFGTILVIAAAVAGTLHAFHMRGQVFSTSHSEPSVPDSRSAADDPAVAASRAARKRREESMALAASDPGVARDLRMGRPDLGERHYDDGGLVDINHVSEAVMVSHLGFSADQARATVEARQSIDGFERTDDLCHMVGIPPRTVDAVRDRILVL